MWSLKTKIFSIKDLKSMAKQCHFEYELKDLHEIILLPLKNNSECHL